MSIILHKLQPNLKNFRETINVILTTTNQEQSTNMVLIARYIIFLDSPTPLLVKMRVISRGSPIHWVPNQRDPSSNTIDSKFSILAL